MSGESLATGILEGDRGALSQAITLIESTRPEDQAEADRLLAAVEPRTGGSHRVGISGVPGVGKSTLIDRLGEQLVQQGHRVAVLAVDPSSTVSGGSILGDKTHMARLGGLDDAYIRPSPSAQTLGGVGSRTREAMLLCEAAGYDVVLIETVGVGQSETLVADMVDTFVVLLLPGGGDELQGIKKGIMEIADIVAVNKADGASLASARETVTEYSGALRYSRRAGANWTPGAVLTSGQTGDGLSELWEQVAAHRTALADGGELEARRQRQRIGWMWGLVEETLVRDFRRAVATTGLLASVEQRILAGELTPRAAARELLFAEPSEPVPALDD
ncbi:MAG: methylmalonyl Co-A mutase-associated GTPase MeaB [Acidobacteria bacterium]|nr:methylmalonyl Co-A mutase-associated GTPase MeaB [Acidobacteriota bacterium]